MSPAPSENPPPGRLLEEVIHPRFSSFDETGSRERHSELTGRIAEYAIICLVVLIIAAMEIGRWVFKTPPQPLLFGFVAFCLTGYTIVRVTLILRQVKVLRRERQARRNLRLTIDDICARGWLFFDGLSDARGRLLGSVLAGPGGVFSLIPRFVPRGENLSETVRRGEGNTVMIGSHQVLADPLGQAREAAHSLYEILAAGGADTVAVQPVVVFPGWTVQRNADEPETAHDTWILSDHELLPQLTGAPAVLEAKDLITVSLICEKLARN